MARIYLDVCCLNRPLDDQRQDRIRLEAEAVERILDRLHMREWEWIGSEVIHLEIRMTTDPERRRRVALLASSAHRSVAVDRAVEQRAASLHSLGFPSVDALHLACAESAGADVFLTTDDKLLRAASRCAAELKVSVCNPLTWLARGAP
ncbi:MAG: type II toxin-antitoxin system VapC family toxin [Acidobacteria bacterium]|nr:type II toxin-antitoxin system VapC family toxin [Acidobacteriota bacterium]